MKKTPGTNETEDYLNAVLAAREKALGIGGDFSFQIGISKEDQTTPFIKISGLTKEKARDLFDLFDEHNTVDAETMAAFGANLQISIDQGETNIDVNYLPNIHSASF